jgi:hypothetical protein
MYICFGPLHERVPLRRSEYVLPETLYAAAMRYIGATRLDVEFDHARYVSIQNEFELALASRLVAAHHNATHATFDDDGWIADTAAIWERALLPPETDDELSACDGADSDGP